MQRGNTRWFSGMLLMIFLLLCAASSSYLLRHDNVFLMAGKTLQQYGSQEDKIVSLAMHDRIYTGTGKKYYMEMHYLSKRKGWNISENKNELIQMELEEYRGKGAKWLVITWYRPDLEHWMNYVLPVYFKRAPLKDGFAVYQNLLTRYPVIFESEHFGILRLN